MNHGRGLAAVLVLTVAGLAGASAPGRRAFRSVRTFACYYQALGTTVHASAWDRMTLSAMLAVTDPAGADKPACPQGARP